MPELKDCIDVGCDPGENFGVICGTIVETGGVDEMDYVVNIMMRILKNVVLDMLSDYVNILITSSAPIDGEPP